MIPAPVPLERTPSNTRAATLGVHCFERKFEGSELRPPVTLVVFDCDETLTLSTFMPREREFERTIGWSSWPEYISMMNFGTPFIEGSIDFEEPYGKGSRLDRLQELFKNLTRARDGSKRFLAVLTRNSRGAVACLNLLMMAKLADHFSAIWSMAANAGMPNGVYKDGEAWKTFHAPLGKVNDHKADVLEGVALSPAEWFPQLAADGAGDYSHLLGLKLENIVLVDDVRTNFQSPCANNTRVFRYCKVARYDGKHPQMGYLTDMGGIGAKRSDDFDILTRFVDEPWEFKAEPHAVCMEQYFEGCEARPPVTLVVFGFDETLSLHTFLPEDRTFSLQIGHVSRRPEALRRPSYSEAEQEKDLEHWTTRNFQSPWVEGSRVDKLKEFLYDLSMSVTGQRTLAVLTENEAGAVAVLNLLLMADLADVFSAIWAPLAEEGLPKGVCRQGEGWRTFDPPLDGVQDRESKGDLLCSIVKRPYQWFPQAVDGEGQAIEGQEHLVPGNLQLYNIVLIDDDMTKFHMRSGNGDHQVLRYCKVACYDDEYLDAGLLIHMGGIGARTEKDYSTVRSFVDNPWKFRVAATPESPESPELPPEVVLTREDPEGGLPKPLSVGRLSGERFARSQTAPPGELNQLEQQKPKGRPPSASACLP